MVLEESPNINCPLIQLTNSNLDIMVQVIHKTSNKTILALRDGENVVIFERVETFQEIFEVIDRNTLTSNLWMLLRGTKDLSRLTWLNKNKRIRLESQIYFLDYKSNASETTVMTEVYRTWDDMPLTVRPVLQIRNSVVEFKATFIWNRRKDLQGLNLNLVYVAYKPFIFQPDSSSAYTRYAHKISTILILRKLVYSFKVQTFVTNFEVVTNTMQF